MLAVVSGRSLSHIDIVSVDVFVLRCFTILLQNFQGEVGRKVKISFRFMEYEFLLYVTTLQLLQFRAESDAL